MDRGSVPTRQSICFPMHLSPLEPRVSSEACSGPVRWVSQPLRIEVRFDSRENRHRVQTSEEIPRNMSDEYFYVRFRFSAKIGVPTGPTPRQHEAVVEVPRDLVKRKKSEFVNANLREKPIALDLARRAALALFSTGEQRLASSPHEEDALWCDDRHPVMNERPCDYEDDGVRAWRIPLSNRSLKPFDP
jgi:hypothetical protein